jgi:hypothetical protein
MKNLQFSDPLFSIGKVRCFAEFLIVAIVYLAGLSSFMSFSVGKAHPVYTIILRVLLNDEAIMHISQC